MATDYLNHFNEALMLAELVLDMPDMIDEFQEWQPRPYKEHFRGSGIADRELAIEAYDISPPEYRQAFDTIVKMLNKQILYLQRLFKEERAALEAGKPVALLPAKCALIRQLIDRAAAVINGHVKEVAPIAGGQDAPNGEARVGAEAPRNTSRHVAAEGETLDQSDIDALFS
ncbi:hypothetical protein GCM10007924_06310 [Sneathiella chinensis]|uniref:Chemotaxis protein CheZ n=1 Tax=Sneathiella chinensis TaxID=349750 RepID=A0ABQ5U2J2_9PROT|nr:hypothetical protein GCM10007924_06310 [Sneathiella chinensis]